MKIGSIVILCHEFDAMRAFWQAALGYTEREPAKNGWVVLTDPDGRGPNISLDQTDRPKPAKRGWLHLDLYTDDQENEVKRLLKLGAKKYPWRYEAGADYVVLEDPDGNLFCVVQTAARA
jgi:catechol 2,3-dioxygenase-like lactoylglutathione lyase family enzyme